MLIHLWLATYWHLVVFMYISDMLNTDKEVQYNLAAMRRLRLWITSLQRAIVQAAMVLSHFIVRSAAKRLSKSAHSMRLGNIQHCVQDVMVSSYCIVMHATTHHTSWINRMGTSCMQQSSVQVVKGGSCCIALCVAHLHISGTDHLTTR